MSSYMEKPGERKRKWYILDSAGKPLGRVAACAASILRGKHLPTFTPHVDCGDHVIILNTDETVLTGKKLQNKVRYRHSGWIGGLREIKYNKLMAEKSDEAMRLAVCGMLPHNSIGSSAAKRLRIYKGSEHKNAAQKPEAWPGIIK